MQLKSLTLENFRNYESFTLDFAENESLALVGPNGQGKTNLLEAVAFLALGKSFRTHRSMESLQWEREHGRIRGTVQKDKREQNLEIVFQREPELKRIKKNGKLAENKDFLGVLKVVLFTPDTLLMVQGAPLLRRQFMDRVLVQISPTYVDALSEFQRSLRQRNALLKRLAFGRARTGAERATADLSQLDPWDQLLAAHAETLWTERRRLWQDLAVPMRDFYQNLAGKKDELTVQYRPETDRMEDRLLAHRDRDLQMGSTSVGPHRDDFSFLLNGRALDEIGSRGECRSAVLALKMAEMRFIEAETGQKPLLLLDDVFSELDSKRQKHLAELLTAYQSLITTTSADQIKGLQGIRVLEINKRNLRAQEPQQTQLG